ncbi:MAG: DsbA family protein [Thermoanaerobaculia bacterium]
MKHHRSVVLFAVTTLLACRAGGTPQSAAPEKPAAAPTAAPAPAASPAAASPGAKVADPRTEALVVWLGEYFPWGPGQVKVEPLDAVRVPGWRLYRAQKIFEGDQRANDQAFLLADDVGKTVLAGDIFVEQERLQAPKPVRGPEDVGALKELLARFLRGRFEVAFEPSRDLRSFKGLTIKHDTGYGAYDIGAYVSSADGAVLLVGRAWDRAKSIAAQRRALIRVDGAPASGPADATVTIVEYSDMQCPFCKKRAADLDALVAKMSKELKIRRVSKSFPIADHAWAFRASSAGVCFADFKKGLHSYWKSAVFARQETLSVAELDTFALDFAVANGMSEEAFRGCYLQGGAVTKVLDDLAEGFAVRVRSTPTYFVDGVPLSWFADPLMEDYLRKTYLKGAASPAAGK